MKAVCLLSGGLDSSTCLGVARREGFECYALSFDYGQRHRVELEAAARVAKQFSVRDHKVARIDLRAFGGQTCLKRGKTLKQNIRSLLVRTGVTPTGLVSYFLLLGRNRSWQ